MVAQIKQIKQIKQILSAILFSTILLSLFSGAIFADNYFTDIDTHWGKDYINKAKEYELVAGMPDGTFQPDSEISYAEFLAILLRVMNIEPIPEDDAYWGTPYLQAAQAEGFLDTNANITEEYGRAKINRIDMAGILSKAITKLGIPQEVEPPVLNDIEGLTPYQETSLETVLRSGVMSGSPTGEFSPFKHSTRAQMAVVFVNLQEKTKAVDSQSSEGNPTPIENESTTEETTENIREETTEESQSEGDVVTQYELGEIFPSDSTYTTYSPNSETIWKLSDEYDNFQFYILGTNGQIIARKINKLPEVNSAMSISFETYQEHIYDDSIFWEYRDANTGETILVLELDSAKKRAIEASPTNTTELLDFELIAEYITNYYRSKHSCSILKHNDDAQAFARKYARKMADGRFFGHTAPDGTTFRDRVEASGLPYAKASENIAYNYNSPINLIIAWINSPSHKDAILSSNEEIGIGSAIADDGEVITSQILFTER